MLEVISSINYDEQEIIKNILQLHADGKMIDCDPAYSTGNFYKNWSVKPKYKFDKYPQLPEVVKATSDKLPLENESIEVIMFDPPFMFGVHGQTKNNIMAKRFTMFNNFNELSQMYKKSLLEFYRVLNKGGIVIFKCQDYTDTQSTFTHCHVHNWALLNNFYVKDLFILISRGRIFNSNLK